MPSSVLLVLAVEACMEWFNPYVGFRSAAMTPFISQSLQLVALVENQGVMHSWSQVSRPGVTPVGIHLNNE